MRQRDSLRKQHRCRALAWMLLGAFAGSASAAGDLPARVDAETGLSTWAWSDAGISLRLAQLLPDQVRAFFQGRGFSTIESERIAAACVFQAELRNTATDGEALAVDSATWRVEVDGGEASSPRTPSQWLAGWGTPPLGRAQAVALRWALFPATQTFAPGDWNMGMLTLELPHGAHFDLVVDWRRGGRPGETTLSGLRCAEDRR